VSVTPAAQWRAIAQGTNQRPILRVLCAVVRKVRAV
jgi:hypothetical protein